MSIETIFHLFQVTDTQADIGFHVEQVSFTTHAYTQVTGNLLCGARSGEGSEERPLAFRRGEGVAGWVAEEGKPALVEDTETDRRFKKGGGFAIRSMLAVPLWSAARVVGVLGLTSPRPSVFSRDDETMAVLLANCAVPCIERARLERLAITDHHTNAYNQRYLFPRLRDDIERSSRNALPLSILLLDLDNFKQVNDRHGHAVGDRVLRIVADRVRGSVRLTDVLVRRGGEEFVLIMPDTGRKRAAAVADRIRSSLSDNQIDCGRGIRVAQTVSIGVAMWNGRETAEELEARADTAMYEAKRKGRNTVVAADRGRDP